MSDNTVSDARGLELLAIQAMMQTKDSRHFMWRVLEQTGVDLNTFDENPTQHAVNAGRRSAGLWLISELKEAAFSSYIEMLKEHHDG